MHARVIAYLSENKVTANSGKRIIRNALEHEHDAQMPEPTTAQKALWDHSSGAYAPTAVQIRYHYCSLRRTSYIYYYTYQNRKILEVGQ